MTGPVVIVRVAPPFDDEAWDEAEAVARLCTGYEVRRAEIEGLQAERDALDDEVARLRAETRAELAHALRRATEYLGDADQAEVRALLAELGDARAALGTAWLYGGVSIAEGIRRKTATLERLAADTTKGGAHAPDRSNARLDRDERGVSSGAPAGGNGTPTRHVIDGVAPPVNGALTYAAAILRDVAGLEQPAQGPPVPPLDRETLLAAAAIVEGLHGPGGTDG